MLIIVLHIDITVVFRLNKEKVKINNFSKRSKSTMYHSYTRGRVCFIDRRDLSYDN